MVLLLDVSTPKKKSYKSTFADAGCWKSGGEMI